MMLRIQFIAILAILLAQGWCKPTKANEGEDYNDDEYAEDYTLTDEEAENENIESTGGPEATPEIISKPRNIRAYTGTTIVLPCDVINAGNTVVVWKRKKSISDNKLEEEFLWSDNKPITTEPNRIVRYKNNTLIIYDATVNDTSDSYVCSILTNDPLEIAYKVEIVPKNSNNNDIGTQSSPTALINVTPSRRVELKQGETLKIGCHINLQPVPKIKWFQKNKRVQDGVQTNDGNFLIIKNVSRHDTGVYQCLAEVGTDKPPHGVIEVVVQYSPVIDLEHENVHSDINMNSKLSCTVHAHPHARVTWYKDGHEISTKKDKYLIKDDKKRHELEILRTSNQDFGQYTCKATNEIGEDTKIITLTGTPSQPTIYSGEMTKGATALMLKWRLESYSPITEYILKYRSKQDDNWTVVSPPVTSRKGNQFIAEHTIEGLRPGSYEAILMARNVYGFSLPSVPYTFTAEYNTDTSASVRGSATTINTSHVTSTVSLLVVVFYAFLNL